MLGKGLEIITSLTDTTIKIIRPTLSPYKSTAVPPRTTTSLQTTYVTKINTFSAFTGYSGTKRVCKSPRTIFLIITNISPINRQNT